MDEIFREMKTAPPEQVIASLLVTRNTKRLKEMIPSVSNDTLLNVYRRMPPGMVEDFIRVIPSARVSEINDESMSRDFIRYNTIVEYVQDRNPEIEGKQYGQQIKQATMRDTVFKQQDPLDKTFSIIALHTNGKKYSGDMKVNELDQPVPMQINEPEVTVIMNVNERVVGMSPDEVYNYLMYTINAYVPSKAGIRIVEPSGKDVTRVVFNKLGQYITTSLNSTVMGRIMLDKRSDVAHKFRNVDAHVFGKLAGLSINKAGITVNVPFSYGILAMIVRMKDALAVYDKEYNTHKKNCMGFTLSQLLSMYNADNGQEETDKIIKDTGDFEYLQYDPYITEYLGMTNTQFIAGQLRDNATKTVNIRFLPEDRYEWLRQRLFYLMIHRYAQAMKEFILGFHQSFTSVITNKEGLDNELFRGTKSLGIELYNPSKDTDEYFVTVKRWMNAFIKSTDNTTWKKLLVFITKEQNPYAKIFVSIIDNPGNVGSKIEILPSVRACFKRIYIPIYTDYDVFKRAMMLSLESVDLSTKHYYSDL